MKPFALAAILSLLVAGVAFADDPMPPEEPAPSTSDEAGAPAHDGSAPDAAAVPSAEDAPPAPPPEPEPEPRDEDRAEPRREPGSENRSAPDESVTRARMSAPQSRRTRARDDDGRGRLDKTEDTVLGGRHWRIKTAQGAVHVWVPPNYERETAGTVVYVHGYFTNADRAWREHELARQFKASRQNAMFVVPDAPAGNGQEVQWPALADLRRAVTRANIRLPDGPIIVVGHSGAFRTVMQWVDHRHVGQIILLDALYSGEAAFDEYIKSGKRADEHKLILVAADTAEGSSSFARKYKFAAVRERVPPSYDEFSKRERRAKLLYIRSQFDHMGIVTSRKVMPVLLRLTRLKAL